jgi:aquaporin Z
MEAALLGLFMVSACVFGVLLEHPSSPVREELESALARRALGGLAMGATLVALVYSPWGRRSGAHMNPSVTLTFLSLGKVERWDAVFYIAAQFAGGAAGVWISGLLIGEPLAHTAVNFAATVPGENGPIAAFVAEIVISLLMMTTVLTASNHARLSRYTGFFAGAMLALFVTFEAPLSGVSLNPARTVGSALAVGEWPAMWVYFTAPPLAMLAAGQLYKMRRGAARVFCAKLDHRNRARCIFRCNFGAIDAQ